MWLNNRTACRVTVHVLMVLISSLPVLIGEDAADGIKNSNETEFKITMTTTFVVPSGKDNIDRLRVYHALPKIRPWGKSTEGYGATNLSFFPDSAKREHHTETDSHYLLWTLEEKLRAGSKHTFTTKMEVRSANRDLSPSAAKIQWSDYQDTADSTPVVDADVLRKIPPELATVASRIKAKYPPTESVRQICKWIVDTVKYDASVSYFSTDVEATIRNRRGHCGHQATVFQYLAAGVGIPMRPVWGMNLFTPDGRKSPLQKVRSDYTNIHTWSEIYLPKVGWVEVDPGMGTKAFALPAHMIQNNAWFQNYAIWMREDGIEQQPEWTSVYGGFRSTYGVENIITYSKTRVRK